MKPTSLDFYFDYLSPFAFFSWIKIEKFCEQYQLELRAHPVVFGKLLDHWGHMGPAEIPPKSQWVGRYCKRYATLAGFDYSPPKYHPFNPLPSLRMSLAEVSGSDQHAVISAFFKAGWTEAEDLGDVANLISILEGAGIARGVFGVPTMIIEEQLFWGNDQYDHMQLLLEGNDPVSPEELD
jgi:2-hydroxychromene-2-carboxylate isomerase